MPPAGRRKLTQEPVNPKTVQMSEVILSEGRVLFTSEVCFRVDTSKLTTNKSENRYRISTANNGKQMGPGVQMK
jgi:hypothetical protein